MPLGVHPGLASQERGASRVTLQLSKSKTDQNEGNVFGEIIAFQAASVSPSRL